ncbi:MAG: presqualene diphosphate synthase HpnD, partial [Candidatus Binatia bacterium]
MLRSSDIVRSRELANDFRFCLEVTRQSASSFYYAFRLLAAERRDALCAVYAFCRAVDDAVDEADPGEAPRLIAEWRRELERCYRGVPLHPVTIALAASLERFAIPESVLRAVIDGVEMDLRKRRYATFAELELYCRRVASAVGLASIEIFGYRNPEARDYAVDVGLALQLTNILRDLSEDAERDRIYLPEEDLRAFDYPPEDLLRGVYNRKFRDLMQFECERARGYYRSAAERLPAEDAASLRPAEVMRRTYERILDRIVDERYFVFGRRLGLSRPRKAALAASVFLGDVGALVALSKRS